MVPNVNITKGKVTKNDVNVYLEPEIGNTIFRWICDGKIVCAEKPCKNEFGVKKCPTNFYLCENGCKPDFVSCKGKCEKNGFFCERQNENVTIPWGNNKYSSTTFGAIGQKRIVNLKYLELQDLSSDSFVTYTVYMKMICDALYQNPEEEDKCCLPMNYRCDGTIECWNGDKSVRQYDVPKHYQSKILQKLFNYKRMKMTVMIAELV